MHSVARINAENISARLRASPIKIPVIIRCHLNPAAFLEIIQQHRLIHVGAEVNFHARILIVCNSAGEILRLFFRFFCVYFKFTSRTSLIDLLLHCVYREPSVLCESGRRKIL